MLHRQQQGRLSTTAGEQGSTLVEFALTFTVVMPILLGIIVFGIAFNNYLALTNATAIGAQAVSVARGQTNDPCAAVDQAVLGQTPFNITQNQPGLNFTLVISPPSNSTLPYPTSSGSSNATYTGTGSGFTCGTTGSGSSKQVPADNLQPYGNLTVTVTYPCNLTVYGVNFAPSCTLTAQTQEAIQ
jgi:Flp pilus assembly protein TadG